MKNPILTCLILLLFKASSAQVSLNHTYNYSASVVKFETLGYKYFLMDIPNAQCRIYNTDHSLFRTINCDVPASFYLSDIKFLSEKLFDNDPGIELLYTFYKYNSTLSYYEYDSKIINEDGSQIQFIDGGMYNYINKTDDFTYKLFSYCFDYSVTPEKVWTNIYNLPGMFVSAQYLNEKSPEILLNAFPNPASNSLKIAYTLPENVAQGTLHLIDNSGRLVERYIVDNHTDHLMLDVSRFKSGVYHYFVEFGNKKTGPKKLVIQ